MPYLQLMRWVRRLSLAFVLLFTLAFLSCQSPQSETRADEAKPAARHQTTGIRRDLSQDEAAGGHTLQKHVGRTDDDLRERLHRERNISAASTYTDRETAEQAVGAAIQANVDKIQRWLDRSGGHPNLVLLYDSDQTIGRTLHHGEDRPEPCSHAVAVLKWDGGRQYHVLTSYPEC